MSVHQLHKRLQQSLEEIEERKCREEKSEKESRGTRLLSQSFARGSREANRLRMRFLHYNRLH